MGNQIPRWEICSIPGVLWQDVQSPAAGRRLLQLKGTEVVVNHATEQFYS